MLTVAMVINMVITMIITMVITMVVTMVIYHGHNYGYDTQTIPRQEKHEIISFSGKLWQTR